jgi:hypothetical protein
MIFNLNNAYEFRWEDHFAGEFKGYAKKFYQIKQFKSQEEAELYVTNMKAGNICHGILELSNEYDLVLESCDGDLIEDFRAKNEFVL